MPTTTLFIRRLTILDCSYLCEKRGIVGETWWADVKLQGTLDEEGVIFDFSHAKKTIKRLIDELADHKCLVPMESKSLQAELSNGRYTLDFNSENSKFLKYACPEEGIAPISVSHITAENVCRYLEEKIIAELPKNILKVSINLRNEELGGKANYHYSHGLKKHYGNCQRMIHGHRSILDISVDGKPRPDLEAKWAKRWVDVYLPSREDILEEFQKDGDTYLRMGYTGNQGYFELDLLKSKCEVFDTDTTVEWIAHFIKAKLIKEENLSNCLVTAYEGIDKGAISE